MGFTKRGKWGTKSRAFRVNHGKFYRPTSVTIGGVNIRTSSSGGRRSAAPRKPTKAEILAVNWRLRPGLYRVTFPMGDQSINLVIDGAEMTYNRMMKLREAHLTSNATQAARNFKTFVTEWDITDDEGNPLPITPKSIERLDPTFIFLLAAASADALGIPKTPLTDGLETKTHGKVRGVVTTLSAPSSSTSPGAAAGKPENVPSSGKQKSVKMTYFLWFFLGLLGGHRYYLGKYGTALLMTLTVGGLGLWWLVDLFQIKSLVRSTG